MFRIPTKAGWTSAVWRWPRLRRKRRNTRWKLRWSQEKCGAGVQRVWDFKRSGYSSINRKSSDAISLVSEETATPRTQEFGLRWSADGGHSFREIVRQQWNFSPPNTTREIEEYHVQLSGVTVLELVIVPDISRETARASLKSFRVS